MRRASFLISVCLLCAALPAPARGQEAPYSMGHLEVKGEDLSRLDLKGARRATVPVEFGAAGSRRVARLVDLGDGALAATGERRTRDLSVVAGTHGTVRGSGAFSSADPDGAEHLARFDYDATDGHRFRSDRRVASASFASRNRELFGRRGDLSADLRDMREHLPGAVGAETRFIRRTARGVTARAGYAPDGETACVSGAAEIAADRLEGRAPLLALSDTADLAAMNLSLEWRPTPASPFAVSAAAVRHRLDLNGAASAEGGEAAFAAHARRELGDTLFTARAGARKIDEIAGRFEGELALRRKLDEGSVLRLSAGRSGRAYGYREILLAAPGYVNLRDAGNGNRFAGIPPLARDARILSAGWRRDLARGWVDLSASAERVDGELIHVARNAADPTVEAGAARDGATIRAATLKAARPLTDALVATASFTARRAREARGDLPFRAKAEAEFALEYAAGATRARAALQGFGPRPVDFAGGRVGGHTELDASIEHRLSDAVALRLDADNLTHRRHADRPGFPARGRLVTGGIEYKF